MRYEIGYYRDQGPEKLGEAGELPEALSLYAGHLHYLEQAARAPWDPAFDRGSSFHEVVLILEGGGTILRSRWDRDALEWRIVPV